MNPGFLAWMNAGNRYVQYFVAETVTIANANYTCTVGKEFTLDLNFETGGAVQLNQGSVLVNKQDLLNAPPRGIVIQFRNAGFRVTKVSDVINAWEIDMIQLSA